MGLSRTQVVVIAMAVACAFVATSIADAGLLGSTLIGAAVGGGVAVTGTMIASAFQ